MIKISTSQFQHIVVIKSQPACAVKTGSPEMSRNINISVSKIMSSMYIVLDAIDGLPKYIPYLLSFLLPERTWFLHIVHPFAHPRGDILMFLSQRECHLCLMLSRIKKWACNLSWHKEIEKKNIYSILSETYF